MQQVHFGIDFGTTNTAVVQIISDEHGIKITPCSPDGLPFPSLLAIHKHTNELLFGKQVKIIRQQLTDDYTVFSSVKSKLGRHLHDDAEDYSAKKVASLYLKYVKDYLKTQLDIVMEDATIAVPVDFSPEQRGDLLWAAQQAGIKVNGFISESTAAYAKHFDAVKMFSRVAVFDWGGGTLDISILEREGNELLELAVYGQKLGGDDIDRLLARKIHANIARRKQLDHFDSMSAKNKDAMILECESAKITLSKYDSAKIKLLDYGAPGVTTESLDLRVFSELTQSITNDAVNALEAALKRARLSAVNLDAIIMVGGSSEMIPVQQTICEKYEKKGVFVIYPENAQWSVAEGAARVDAYQAQYRLYKSIGVVLADGTFFPVLRTGASIPHKIDEISFGVVEETNNARMIFADEDMNQLEIATIPVKGFTSEGISMMGGINKDMVARFTLKSTHMPDASEAIVELNELHLYYDLADLGLVPRQAVGTKPKARKKPNNLCSFFDCQELATDLGYCEEHCRYVNVESR